MRDRLDLSSDLRPSASHHARFVEVAAFSLTVPLLRIAFGCRDPFLWEAPCPWLMFVPLLAGALHGALGALFSAALLAGLLFLHAAHGGVPISALALRWGVPCCALGVIAGRIADAQRERVGRLQRQLQQLMSAVSRERRSREVLQVSHRRLAGQLPQPVGCLQASLEAARIRLSALGTWPERGKLLLGVLAEHAGVQAASLFVLDAAGGALELAAVAQLGGPAAPARDLLVQRAFRSGKLAMPAQPESLLAATADVLAALPLVDDGRVLGVVAIQQLPFEAFEPRHLQESMLLLAPLSAAIAQHAPRATAEESTRQEQIPVVLEARWGGIA
jgi:polysaccharide biosynthesis protein PelD